MVDELPREMATEGTASRADGKNSELPENGALLKSVEESQVSKFWVT